MLGIGIAREEAGQGVSQTLEGQSTGPAPKPVDVSRIVPLTSGKHLHLGTLCAPVFSSLMCPHFPGRINVSLLGSLKHMIHNLIWALRLYYG